MVLSKYLPIFLNLMTTNFPLGLHTVSLSLDIYNRNKIVNHSLCDDLDAIRISLRMWRWKQPYITESGR